MNFRVVRVAGSAAVLAAGCLFAAPLTAGAGAATLSSTVRASPAGLLSPAARNHNFGSFAAAKYLSCTHSAKITGTFGLKVAGVTSSFRKWATRDGGHSFAASLGWRTTVSAAVHVTGETTCEPGKALKKNFSVTFVIDGVKIKLSPDFRLMISARGGITATQTISQSVRVSGKIGGLHVPVITPKVTREKPTVTASGSATFDALIGAEADITAGVVDLDFELLGGIHATARAQSSPAGVCVSGYPELRVIGFFGVTFLGWHKDLKNPFLDRTWLIKSVAGHSTAFSLCTYTSPKIIKASFTDQGISLTYTPPGNPPSPIADYRCKASPNGGKTIYPCDGGGGPDNGIGTADPATAPVMIYVNPGYLRIAPGWSIAMAAVTSGGTGPYGPWYTLANPLKAPVITSVADGAPGEGMTVAYDSPPAVAGLTIRDYRCEVSPDGGTTVYPCDGGGGPDNGFGTADPANVPNEVYIDPGYLDVESGWSIRIWAVADTVAGQRTGWHLVG